VNPNNGVTGSNAALAVNGTNFVDGAVISFKGSPISTSFVSATLLTGSVALPLVAQTVQITVTNPGNVVSNAVDFFVIGPVAPPPPPPALTPTISNVSPNTITQGASRLFGISGTNFAPG